MAAGVAAAVLVSALPGAPAPTATGAAPAAARAPRPSGRAAQPMTAREVLLAAAAHVARGPVTGRYWRVTMIGGVTVPGGTAAHPYDISLRTYADQWNPSSAGRKAWLITRNRRPSCGPGRCGGVARGRVTVNLAQRPASQQLPGRLSGRMERPARRHRQGISPQRDLEAQRRHRRVHGRRPGGPERRAVRPDADPAAARRGDTAPLRQARCGNPDCSTVHQLMWAEALMLLQDPVSAPVRSATFKVMAGLPGVRLIGKIQSARPARLRDRPRPAGPERVLQPLQPDQSRHDQPAERLTAGHRGNRADATHLALPVLRFEEPLHRPGL